MYLTPQTFKLFAVIGHPIKHSLSPLIHNYAIQKLKLNAFYTRFPLPSDINANDLRNFLIDSHLHGINITLPFKEKAYEICDEVETIAKNIGAINTIVKKSGKLYGYNTDAEGFWRCIQHLTPKHILILGAGGSARSIATILSHHNIAITIANRSSEKLQFFRTMAKTLSFIELSQTTNMAYDIIINTTSAGIDGKSLPLSKEILSNLLHHTNLAFDIMYHKDSLTPFCNLAQQCNVKSLDGKAMLVYQAAIAFLYFHELGGNSPLLSSIIEYMNEIIA